MATYDDATRMQSAPQMPGKPMTTPINRDQRTAIVAAVGGTAALGGAAYALSRLEDSDNAEMAENTENVTPPPAVVAAVTTVDNDLNNNGIPDDQEKVTAAVDNDLNDNGIPDDQELSGTGGGAGDGGLGDDDTFDKAFAEARAAQGPGHAFEWHGNLYSTYYEEEWADMDGGDRNEFYASLGIDLPGADGGGAGGGGGAGSGGGAAEAYAANETVEFSNDDADVAAVAVVDKDPTAVADAGVTVLDPNAPDPDSVPVATNTDDSIIMLDPNTPDPDSVPVVANSEDPSISVVTLDGHEMALIDTDHDNQADIVVSDDNVVLIDTDGDHKFDTQALYNAETRQLENVETLDSQIDTVAMNDRAEDAHLADNTHDMDMGMDFNSHADVSDFAL